MSRSDLIDLTLHLHHETKPGDPEAGAYLVSDSGEDEGAVWLPKSQVERGPEKGRGIYEFTLPEWLAQSKGLI